MKYVPSILKSFHHTSAFVSLVLLLVAENSWHRSNSLASTLFQLLLFHPSIRAIAALSLYIKELTDTYCTCFIALCLSLPGIEQFPHNSYA